MSVKLVEYLKLKFNGSMLNNGVRFETDGVKFLYSEGRIFNLDTEDSLEVSTLFNVQNFIKYSVNKNKNKKNN